MAAGPPAGPLTGPPGPGRPPGPPTRPPAGPLAGPPSGPGGQLSAAPGWRAAAGSGPAVGAPGAADRGGPGPGDRPRPERERPAGRLLGVPVGQILCWEAAAAVLLAGAVHGGWPLLPAVAGAALIGALTLVRWQGRWLYAVLAVRLRYRARRHRRPAGTETDLRLAALTELRPELSVIDVEPRPGQRFGVCSDGTAWVGVIAVQAGDDVLADPLQPDWLPVRELAGALVVDDIELTSVQLVCHVTPAPSGTLPAGSPVAASYQQVKAGRTPASQQMWIALRLDPARGPDAIEARGGGSAGAQRALRRCVARVLELLAAAGVTGLALDGEALRSVLALAGATRPVEQPAGARRTIEAWTCWQADDIAHITWWVTDWPGRAAPLQLLTEVLAAVPALTCTLSLSLHPAPAGTARFRCLVRLAAVSPDAAELAATALEQLTAAAGLGLFRLDGEQALGYAATLPLGGGTP